MTAFLNELLFYWDMCHPQKHLCYLTMFYWIDGILSFSFNYQIHFDNSVLVLLVWSLNELFGCHIVFWKLFLQALDDTYTRRQDCLWRQLDRHLLSSGQESLTLQLYATYLFSGFRSCLLYLDIIDFIFLVEL